MITEHGIPISDACLWLDLVSLNSYLTGERYAYALLRYFRFLKKNTLDYRHVVSKQVIEEYLKDLLGLESKIINVESRMTFTALNTYITVLKSFYHWLEDEKKAVLNPVLFSSRRTRNLPFVNTKLLYGQVWNYTIQESILNRVTYRKKRSHLKWYSNHEIDTIRKHFPTIRDETVFMISIETGMRIGEILGLKLEHFDPFESSLNIVRQQNSENKALAKTLERTLFINSSLVDLIQSYIHIERSVANLNNTNYLFVNLKGIYIGKPLKPRNFLRILKNAGEISGLERSDIRTHSGRSTRAQQLVEIMRDNPELGLTQTFIDEEMGWKSPHSIKNYEKGYSNRQKKKIMSKLEPILLVKQANMEDTDDYNN
ncbi:tyrosine-type recombinase/integrase [Paenibacillus xylanexedens]|nr:tyrosine-type recombinase/integrase [Paenibacillus xylanexedens]